MIESKVVNEWIALGRTEGEAKGRTEGEVNGRIAALISILEARFGHAPRNLEAALRATSDLGTLEAWVPPAVTAATRADFRRATGG